MPAKNNITKLDQELTIVVGGQAGQGMQTLGLLLSRAFLKFGFFISTYQSYQSRIRGGHNFYQIRVSAHPITSVRSRIDILVALDQETLEQHCSHISEQGLILADTKITSSPAACVELLALDIAGLLPPAQQSEIYTTSFFAGALAGLIQLSPGIFTDILKSILVKKDEQIIADNTAVFHAGYQALVASSVWSGKYQLSPPAKKKNYLNLHGNQAIALGAIAAGCKFYSAYPMTPATSIFETLAKWAAKTGMVVEQAEDEIAALNMVLGASYAGVRAMTGTSGGGFALMVEAVSLAGMTECPAVIVNAQRPGPATGLPTRTEQGDLEMVIYAGHGEFPRVVLTPGNHQQCFTLTMLAFNLAEQYQIPVMVLTDQYLADLYSNISVAELNPIAIERGKVVTSEAGYQRYAFSEDGISPRAFPGQGTGVVITDSDEHAADGHLTEDLTIRQRMHEKRLQKRAALIQVFQMPEVSGHSQTNGVICWGSNYGICQEIIRSFQADQKEVALIHFTQCWPLPEEPLLGLFKPYKNLICVENNATGQLAHLLRAETSIKVAHNILKYNGEPFYLDELREKIAACLI